MSSTLLLILQTLSPFLFSFSSFLKNRAVYVWCIVVPSISHVRLFTTPWIAARQASLFFAISQSLLKLMSIELMMPFNHLILSWAFNSYPQSFPASRPFPVSQLFASGGQSFSSNLSNEYSRLISLGVTGLISLLSKGLSRVFSRTTV